MRTVSIINQKGGSGKTTTAINLAASLARRSQRTLLVDMDPQSHCALGVAIPEDQIELQIGDALLARAGRAIDLSRLIWQVSRNLEVIPSSTKLAGIEAARGGLAERDDRDLRLATFLKSLSSRYDICIIDCSPSIGLLTFNALRAASEVLIPVETSYFALQGAGKQVATIRALCRRFAVRIPYRILPTMHDPESSLARDILCQLRKRFEKRIFDVVIRLDPKLREAASLGLPVHEHDVTSTGAKDHDALAQLLCGLETAPAFEDAEPLIEQTSDDPARRHLPNRPRLLGRMHHESDPAPSPTLTPMTRAAELAARTRRLAMRSAQLNDQLDSDPAIAGAAAAPKPEAPTPPPVGITTEAKTISRFHGLYGSQSTSRGLTFSYPAGPQSAIYVAGDHNGWSTTATPMRYNAETGLQEACVRVPPGVYKYRLIINGQWLTDPHNPRTEPNPYGGYDSVAIVYDHDRTIADAPRAPEAPPLQHPGPTSTPIEQRPSTIGIGAGASTGNVPEAKEE